MGKSTISMAIFNSYIWSQPIDNCPNDSSWLSPGPRLAWLAPPRAPLRVRIAPLAGGQGDDGDGRRADDVREIFRKEPMGW